MASNESDTGKHEQARELTEQALDKLVEGDDVAAQKLVDQAKKISPSGVKEVVDDLNEDAATRGTDPAANI